MLSAKGTAMFRKHLVWCLVGVVVLAGCQDEAKAAQQAQKVKEAKAAQRAAASKPGTPTVYTKWPFDAKEAKRRQEETAAKLKTKTTIALDLGKGVTMKLVLIPAGKFLMGSGVSAKQLATQYGEKAEDFANEYPQHEVQITKPFYMGVTEVTQGQWKAVMGTEPWKGDVFVKEGECSPTW